MSLRELCLNDVILNFFNKLSDKTVKGNFPKDLAEIEITKNEKESNVFGCKLCFSNRALPTFAPRFIPFQDAA